MIHWLTTTVWPQALHAIIYTVSSAVTAIVFVAPLRGAIRRIRKQLSTVLDSLDPDVPVGLTEQLGRMEAELDAMRERLEGRLHVEVRDDPLVSPHRK